MKTNNSRLLLLVALISLIAVGFVTADETDDKCVWAWTDKTVPLIAGQHYNAGSVTFTIDEANENVVATFQTTGDWKLTESHLYLGDTSPPLIPGQFPYKYTDASGVTIVDDTTHIYTIPFSDFASFFDQIGTPCEPCEEGETCENPFLYAAAHASVISPTVGEPTGETAWGDKWRDYFTIDLTCVCDGNGGTQEEECFNETIWAATAPGESRFVEQGNWATYITYTLGSGSAENPEIYNLYAGQDILAGTLEVYDEDGMLFVNYVEGSSYMDCIGSWTLTESHLQIAENGDFSGVINRGGNPVPGQFQYTAEDGSNGISLTKTGDIQIAAHGVMEWCGVCPN